MSHNRFISSTLRIEVVAVRYRHHSQIYEVKAEVYDEGNFKRFQPRWMYLESMDADLKQFAIQTKKTPEQMVRYVHQCIRQEQKVTVKSRH